MAKLSDDELREFLMRWLMEFGTEVVSPYSNKWYLRSAASTQDKPLSIYIDSYDMSNQRLNQAGLDFIKGE